MAEGIDDQQVDKICADIKQELYRQLQTNTRHLFRLRQLQIQGKYEAAAPVEDTISTTSTMPKMVKDIIKDLEDTNMGISDLIGDLPVGTRDSVYSRSSGIASLTDSTDEDLTEAVQEEGNGDAGQMSMRPASEYFMERQGTASQTPRRGRGTRQVVDDTDVTEEEPSTQSTTL